MPDNYIKKPRKPASPFVLALLLATTVLLLAGAAYAITAGNPAEPEPPVNETAPSEPAPAPPPDAAPLDPEAWTYTFTPTLGQAQFGLRVETVSNKDNDTHQSENVTLDEYGAPRLEARVFALPFDITGVGLGADPLAGLNEAMIQLGDAPSYAVLRAKTSGVYMDFVAPYYMTFDGENVTALRSIAMTSTQTRQVLALNSAGALLVWDPAEWATCAQYRPDDLGPCVGLSWVPAGRDAAGRALMAAG